MRQQDVPKSVPVLREKALRYAKEMDNNPAHTVPAKTGCDFADDHARFALSPIVLIVFRKE